MMRPTKKIIEFSYAFFLNQATILSNKNVNNPINSDVTWKMTFLGYPVFLNGTAGMEKCFDP